MENSSKNIGFAFFLNLFFAIFELVGGLYTNSIAILSDALHDFGDALSLGVAFFLQKKSTRKSDRKYTYGYKRFSLLGSVIISTVLAASSVFVIYESILRLIDPVDSNVKGMAILAIIGIIVNGTAVIRLKKGTTLNERAVFLHMMEDVLGWIAVLIGSIIMVFVDLPILDPLMSLGITVWVLYNAYKNLSQTMKIMLQEAPDDVDMEKLKQEIELLDKINSIHDVHIWTLDGEHHVLTLHAVVDTDIPADAVKVKQDIRDIAARHGVSHVTIEYEASSESCCCGYNGTC